ncbi:hypothetical protein PBT90_11025 [Algoriphagus halophytocola]|uniref:Transposase n=1 Tax=Algoriphagus halophytocola TaxID=2991499 RepID=A0ABY6MLB1_9BACT|nr:MULTISPECIES: hypothetical protein [unclassified Algoriphagus]UZD23920.1 hypothetical protein OM944_05365 [Algoriphagus sp. TR-M5]WBL41288.1 hypothetical protein PBT90_11025 [Algoriphagus sp. TR-M9]
MILTKRRIIYAQDIMILTGRSRSYAYYCMKRVREHYGKSKHQLITFQEFADFHGIPVDDLGFSLIHKTKAN